MPGIKCANLDCRALNEPHVSMNEREPDGGRQLRCHHCGMRSCIADEKSSVAVWQRLSYSMKAVTKCEVNYEDGKFLVSLPPCVNCGCSEPLKLSKQHMEPNWTHGPPFLDPDIKAKVNEAKGTSYYGLECPNCGVTTPTKSSKLGAASAWGSLTMSDEASG